MKRLVLCLSLTAVTTSAVTLCPAFATEPSHAAAVKPAASKPVAAHKPAPRVVAAVKPKVAPADEYFGRLKMSILGIRNEIKDLGLKAEGEPAKAEQIFATANLTEDAMKDWEHKYPADSWLPKTVFALERMYNKVATDQGRARAKSAMQWLIAHYPKTYYAKLGRVEMAQGKVGAPLVPVATAASAAPAAAPADATAAVSTVAAPPAATPAITNSIVVLPASSLPSPAQSSSTANAPVTAAQPDSASSSSTSGTSAKAQ